MTDHQITPPHESKPTLSPLSQQHTAKEWVGKIALVVIAGLLLYAIFTGNNNPSPKKETHIETAEAAHHQAPKLALTPKEQQRLAQNMPQIDQGVAPNNTLSDAQKLQQMREAANTLVYQDDSGAANSATNQQNQPGTFGNAKDGNSQFLAAASQSTVPTIKARQLHHLGTLLAQGNIIAATLESRIASDLPGMVRAITASDVYSEDNSRVLLPKGSRLIGQYNSGIAQGQNRVFVVWQRLIRPDGIDIQLNSPGTDALGTAGLAADNIDHHFFQQFGTAALLSVIGAGAANAGVNSNDNLNSASAYRSAVANSFSQSAQTTLQNQGVIKPTLYINQGQVITVFVAKDLDFYDTLKGFN